jgi:dihydrodipicolinate synthase/N-acetylneuraminate lyase
MPELTGPVFAIVTPFNQSGDIDRSALSDLLSFLEENGVRNIIVNGTTAEFPSLTLRERTFLTEFCRANFTGTILSHISSCSVKDCLYYLDQAKELADGALLLSPWYYSNTDLDGIKSFFDAVLEKCEIPIFLYNFPKHTGYNLLPEFINQLYKSHNCIKGVKDSSGNMGNCLKLKKLAPLLTVYMGADSLALKILESTLDGSVTGGGNPFPECLVEMYKSFISEEKKTCEKWQKSFNLWTDYRKSIKISEISMTKIALNTRIKAFPTRVRPPLKGADPEMQKKIIEHIKRNIIPRMST